jgi:AcrR family transcriptional regulator
VQQICRGAQANVAAVNYYFGSKAELYRAAWRQAADLTQAAYAPRRGGQVSTQTWLKEHVRGRISAIFDEGPAGWFPQMIYREMADPSPMREALHEEFIEPMRQELVRAVAQLLGAKATRRDGMWCAMHIVSEYVMLNVARQNGVPLFARERPVKAELEALIGQTQRFVMAGVRGVRRAVEEGGAT